MTFKPALTRLEAVLNFSNGRTSPERTETALFQVFGSNGLIGKTEVANSPRDTIVIGRVGSYCGSVHFSRAACWVTDNAIRATAKGNNDPGFLYHLLKHLNLNNWSSGSGQPLINQATLNAIEAQVPHPMEQRAIFGFVGAIDDRISLLIETNATLEAIAQALFKSWFVDFDPVRAKMEGLVPEGVDEDTAALFSDGLEDSELGMIPKGWEVASVESFSQRVGMGPFGSNIKVETFVSQGVPVISGQHLKKILVEDLDFNYITEEHADKLANSCVYGGDVIFTHAGSIGQVSLLHAGARFDKYILSQRQFFLRCDVTKMRPEWITYFFRSPRGQHLILANASQVGVPSIARPVSYLRSIKLAIPPMLLIDRFAELSKPMHRTILENTERISTLVALRDILFPRLISGQLRLPDVENQIAAIAA